MLRYYEQEKKPIITSVTLQRFWFQLSFLRIKKIIKNSVVLIKQRCSSQLIYISQTDTGQVLHQLFSKVGVIYLNHMIISDF